MKNVHIEKLDLNLLVVLQTIYAEGSVTRAAARLNLTQSALSHSLRRLRQVLDDPLFLRSGAALVATPFTRNLMGPLEIALHNVQSALNAANTFDPASDARRFVVAMDERLEAFILPTLVRQILASGPGIGLSSIRLDQANLEESLLNGRIDAAVSAAELRNPNFRRALISKDSLVVLASRKHPIAQGDAITIEQYLQCDHLAVINDKSYTTAEDTILSRAGYTRSIRMQVQRYVGAMTIVAHSELLVTAPKLYATVVNHYAKNNIFAFPVATDPVEFFLYWNAQMEADLGIVWLKTEIERCFQSRIT
ncbi:LysR family transcriptional regulator [Simplicispira suum]|uniref:LysR family transcriptional regulator n=1 Tax=Simplicispira suum TaxID=2109915 RepID=A0A2S0MZI9_9BURK|nr:LysR family transcriptional regulator [Simplicispira suum]AVO41310.1 LysR family transcriptional regulator [Simplicispira suum]MBW7832463.1 LysR family transcriptional regulator [Simplicispira suum]